MAHRESPGAPSPRRRGIVVHAAFLKFLRYRNHLTQAQLAWALSYSERTIRNAELGKSVDIGFLRAAAAHFAVPESTLIEHLPRDSEGALWQLWRLVADRLEPQSFSETARERLAANAVLHCDQGEIEGADPIIDHLAHRIAGRLAGPHAIAFVSPEHAESPSSSFAACRWILFSSSQPADPLREAGAMTSAILSRGKLKEIWEYWRPDTNAADVLEGSPSGSSPPRQ
jgi:transcriptional regulator with XRE-family HTH domain